MTIHFGSFALGVLCGALAVLVVFTVLGLAVNLRRARAGALQAASKAVADAPIDADLKRIQAERIAASIQSGIWQ